MKQDEVAKTQKKIQQEFRIAKYSQFITHQSQIIQKGKTQKQFDLFEGKKKSYPAVMLLGEILSIDITLGNSIIRIDGQSGVSNLHWQSIFQIQKANLADIFQLTASLTNLCFLISCITTRPPSENRERPCTNLALLVIIRFCLCIYKYIQ